MASIRWCIKQKNGIKLIEPNINLCGDYLETAQETLSLMRIVKGRSKVWLATMKYYCEYFAVYSMLMRLGIKCEIHDCTIMLSGFLEEQELLPKGTRVILEEDRQLRLDNQYYLKNHEIHVDHSALNEFVLAIKDLALRASESDIMLVRSQLK
jgi:uncharacterized protein (UPF0332 family)